MAQTFVHWILSAIIIFLAALLVPGVSVTFVGALLAAVVLGLLTVFIKPILSALTLPVNILTLGLFSLVINAALVYAAAFVVPGFAVANFWWALLYGVVLALLNLFFGLGFEEPARPVSNE